MKKMKILQKITVFYLGFLSVILPLKFASLTMMPESTVYFPEAMWEYLIVNFPAAGTGMATGTGLLLSIVAFGREFFKKQICFNLTLAAWIAAAYLSLSGFVNASTADYPVMAIGHIAGFLAYAFSIYIYWQTHENSLKKIFTWWTVGLLLVLANGLHQYFWGFDDQLAFYYSESGQAANVENIDLSSKMTERRIFSTFGGSNVLAGYLMLMGAIGFYIMYRWAGNFAPPKQSRILLCGVFTAAAVWVLINTGSRGAIAAVGGALIYTLFWLDIRKRYKIAGAVIVLAVICGLICSSVFFGRTFGSFAERIGYWRSAFLMMQENWYLGSGWGDFFVDNMRFRVIDLDETARGPHNLFLIFGCSCGIFAMFAVMFASLWALYKASMKFYREKTMQNCAVMISIGGFLLHAMLDVNFQIPASMAIFCTLTIIAADDEKTGDRRSEKIAFYISCILILLAAFGYSYRLTAGEKAFDSFKTMIHQSLRENKFTTAQIIQKYNEVEKYRPYSSFHVMDLYHYYYAKRMYREALYYLDLGIQRSPERAGNYYTKAVYMLTVGELEKAEESINEALKCYPRSIKYRNFKEKLKKNGKNTQNSLDFFLKDSIL